MGSSMRRGDDEAIAPLVESVRKQGINPVGDRRCRVAFEEELGHCWSHELTVYYRSSSGTTHSF